MVEDPIIISLGRIELNSKTTDIADSIGATSFRAYDRDTHHAPRLFSDPI